MKRLFLVFICSAAVSCSDILDPLPNGHYTDGNYENYPSVIRGFIDKGYSLLPTTYAGNEYAYLECATDNAVARERTERAEILWAEFHRVVVIFFRGTP